MNNKSKVSMVNGPVVKANPMRGFKMREMVTVGEKELIGEVVKLNGDDGTIQVYEETEGLKVGDEVIGTGKPLSVKLGPGMMGNMFDGIERPLDAMLGDDGFIGEGIGLISIELDKTWSFEVDVAEGDMVEQGQIFARCKETDLIEHRLMIPDGINGKVVSAVASGDYKLMDVAICVEDEYGKKYELNFYQEWPVRTPRPVKERMMLEKPLITGQRVLDMFFPLAKGGRSKDRQTIDGPYDFDCQYFEYASCSA